MNDQRLKNLDAINSEIFMKNSSNPYIAPNAIYRVNNDMDVFPYPRWFQAVPTSDKPIVAEREAGWMYKNKELLRKEDIIKKEKLKPANLCFQTACSTIYPCYQQNGAYIEVNKACISEYR